jgi:hypothetical protein
MQLRPWRHLPGMCQIVGEKGVILVGEDGG